MALNRDKLDEMAQPRPQEDVDAAKRRKAARKVTSNPKIANTTITKAYTDIEQGSKLAKILPLESADMFYFCSPFDEEYFKNPRFGVAEHNTDEIPCWSLAALLKAISGPKLWEMKGEWYATSQLGCFSKGYSNPIDACVEILTRL